MLTIEHCDVPTVNLDVKAAALARPGGGVQDHFTIRHQRMCVKCHHAAKAGKTLALDPQPPVAGDSYHVVVLKSGPPLIGATIGVAVLAHFDHIIDLRGVQCELDSHGVATGGS